MLGAAVVHERGAARYPNRRVHADLATRGATPTLAHPMLHETYRSLDQLTVRGFIRPVGEEPGIAGGNRTILAATRTGRAQLRTWLATPVAHHRSSLPRSCW